MKVHEKTFLLSEKSIPTHLTWEQMVFTFIVITPAIGAGMVIGFPAVALPQLKLDLSNEAWFASLPHLSSMICTPFIGFILDRYGRKVSLLFTAVSEIMAFLLLSVGDSSTILLLQVGQLFGGCSLASATIVPVVYITESIASDNLNTRNSLASWMMLSFISGISLVFFLGPLLNYANISIAAVGLGIFSLFTIIVFLPESPVWLHQNGRHRLALYARKRLSFQNGPIMEEAVILSLHQPLRESQSLKTYLLKLIRKDVYKPLIASSAFFIFIQFSGATVFTTFAVDLLSVKHVNIDPYYLTVVSGIIQILPQITYIFVVPHTGVKKLGICSGLTGGLCVAILGLSVCLNQVDNDFSYIIDWLHIASIWIYTYVNAPLCSISYTIMGEIFPPDAKGFGSIAYIVNSMAYFIIVWVYAYGLQYLEYYIYYLFAVVNIVTAIHMYFFIPETVGKSLQEIHNHYLY